MIPSLPDKTQQLVVSYVGVRRAIGLAGLLLPVLLGPMGWLFFGIEFQDTMSGYYHTALRDVFVGTLCGMGIFLFCYRGHDWVENWTANIGCVAALAVALFPLDANSDPLRPRTLVGIVHNLSGVVFFLTLAFYSLVHFPSSKSTNQEREPHERVRDLVYRASGTIILLSMLAMAGYLFVLPAGWKIWCNKYSVLFWLESIAVWAFASAWLTKGRVIVADLAIEMLALTQAQFEARVGTLAATRGGPRAPRGGLGSLPSDE